MFGEQASPIFKGVTEIIINSQLARVKTRQHNTRKLGGHHEWQWFTTTIKEASQGHLSLVSSSMHMPQRTHRGWHKHYPIVHP
jgi:hypothetical protein